MYLVFLVKYFGTTFFNFAKLLL